MPQPIIRAQVAKLNAGSDETKLDILERFAAGERVVKIIKSYGVTTAAFYKWLRENPDMNAAWLEAKAFRAQSYADDAQDASEAPAGRDKEGNPLPIATENVNHGNLRVKTLMWLAASADPKAFGKQPEKVLSIGTLHLEAVQEINRLDTEQRMKVLAKVDPNNAQIQGADPDYEVVDDVLEAALA